MPKYENARFPFSEVEKVINQLEETSARTERELMIASLIVYALMLSDPTITDSPQRLKTAAASVADHIVFVLEAPMAPMPKYMN